MVGTWIFKSTISSNVPTPWGIVWRLIPYTLEEIIRQHFNIFLFILNTTLHLHYFLHVGQNHSPCGTDSAVSDTQLKWYHVTAQSMPSHPIMGSALFGLPQEHNTSSSESMLSDESLVTIKNTKR